MAKMKMTITNCQLSQKPIQRNTNFKAEQTRTSKKIEVESGALEE